MLLNSPHNPTGKVFSRDELETVAELCREHDLVALSDEVYEHLVYEGEHVPLATLDGMAERTLTISSLGKTFSVTGWKIGWASGPRRAGRRRAGGQAVPLVRGRHAVAARGRRGAGARRRVLRRADGELRGQARPPVRRACAAAGLEPLRPAGTYFVNARVDGDGAEFCRALPERAGVVAIPTAVFYDHPEVGPVARALRVLQARRA